MDCTVPPHELAKPAVSSRPSSAVSSGQRSSGELGIFAPADLSGGPCKNSMTRLPDEAPAATSQTSLSLGRPSSAPAYAEQKAPGTASMERLPDDHPVGTFTRSGSSSSLGGNKATGSTKPRSCSRQASGDSDGQKASLQRLPDENRALAGEPRPPSKNSNPDRPASGKPKLSALRDRLNKNLTVSTITKQEPSKRNTPAVFRTLQESEAITDFYEFGEDIYNGGAKGKVLIAKQRSDGAEVVVKIRMKSASKSGERTWRTIMGQVYGMRGSQHVLDIIEIAEDNTAFYVVMPKCNGGELFDFLATETEVPEAECKRIIREILTAVGHLHDNNMVHRDIKPENIMFDQDMSDPTSPKSVKLIDFDTCLGWAVGTPKSRRFVGTPGYIAPEALLGEICPQSDLWSIGVILYILMTGEMPWSSLASLEDGMVGSPGAIKMYNALKAEVLDWDKEPWPDFPLARDLCQKLMAFDVDERIGETREALSHPWLSR